MGNSLKRKRRLWVLVWCACCAGAASAMLWAVQRAQPVCRQSDLEATTFVSAQALAEEDGEKRVFLTFDDGPSSTTETVLDILKEKGVPATFFVVSADNNKDHLPLIKRAVEEGHQIALHSCTHSYKTIYASTTAFWADIKELRQQIAPYVDLETVHWIRFPGGSTNTVSHKYGGSSIMKNLVAQAGEKGYRYVDWNVCAEDAAGGHPSADDVYRNVVKGAEGKNVCVVLMHDTKATRKTTAEALPDIIDWFKEQGYRFCRIDELDRQI